ncbi:MAG: hypothetical protein Fur0011_1710 [Candidatus Microgenomates bacterium]
MNQHPVPQNVTQYQFRLVGDMTLKQFLELAGGIVLAVLFYSSNLIFIFKWPLVLLSVFFGIALAFFPIEDRPLDQWIINFFNAIYKPTRFTWKKTNKIPSIFTFTPHPIAATNTITKTIKAPTQNQNINASPSTDLSQVEDAQIKSLNSLFSSTAPTTPPTSTTPSDVIYDKPTVTVRKLKAAEKTVPPPINATKSIAVPTIQPASKVGSKPNSEKTQETAIPNNLIFQSSSKPVAATPQSTVSTKLKSIKLPTPPRSPNLIVGITTGKDGKLIEGAIVQVLDTTGVPARAMKTNALGQFATSTPLSPGTYRIEVEADGHTFPTQQLIINNTIIQPFEIQAVT